MAGLLLDWIIKSRDFFQFITITGHSKIHNGRNYSFSNLLQQQSVILMEAQDDERSDKHGKVTIILVQGSTSVIFNTTYLERPHGEG